MPFRRKKSRNPGKVEKERKKEKNERREERTRERKEERGNERLVSVHSEAAHRDIRISANNAHNGGIAKRDSIRNASGSSKA